MTPLTAEALVLATFLNALFPYADEGTYVSWRAFRDDTKDAPPVFIESSQIAEGDTPLVAIADAAAAYATRAAQFPQPAVFCPPIATFTDPKRAREIDLANGLALSVECDTAPAAARETLEAILGAATVVVASGGLTTDGEEKLHLHWRLAEPTTDAASHAQLKRARILATAIVGGDATNVPAVHPIRWPGSWHRKSTPRLATIVHVDAEREIQLSHALEQLELVAPAFAPVRVGGDQELALGDSASMSKLVRQLITGEAMHAPLVALAFRYLKAGMADAQCVLTLRGLMDVVPEGARSTPELAARWTGHYKDIPRTVRTAREKLVIDDQIANPDLTEFLISNNPPAFIAARQLERRDIPTELLTPPGVLADVARYGVDSAVRPVPIFAVQAALALGSIVCSRRYVTSHRNYSSLYFLNVARSGTGKEEAKTTIEGILKAAGARRLIGPSSYSSKNAVFSALLAKPQHLTILDEFGKYLEAAMGQRGDQWKNETLTQLIEVFGRVHGDLATPQFSTMTLSPTAAAQQEPRIIVRPAITVLAMTTPTTFYDAMHSSRIADGFLNRFLVVEHQAPRGEMRAPPTLEVPPAAINWVKQILAPHGDLDIGPQTETVGAAMLVDLTGPALSASQMFEREMLALADQLEPDGLGDMPIRASEIALRLALICGLADTPDTPIVTVDCVDWATAYVRFFLEQTIALVKSRVADSHTERVRNTVLNAIRAAGARGITERDLHRDKAFIGLPTRDRRDAIESLLAGELIVWADIPRDGSGRPRHAIVAIMADQGVECREIPHPTEVQSGEPVMS